LRLDGFFAVPVSFLRKRKKMLDARDVATASHCAAALAFWIDCSPIDSPPIIAFPRETIVDSYSRSKAQTYAHTHTQTLIWLL
jgi:hypothetical protein